MKSINTGALALCVLTFVVACGVVLSTGISWTKYEYRSSFFGYRCVPSETLFQEDETDPVTCSKICDLTNKCISFFYQPDNGQCIGCRVYFYPALWTNRYEELPGSMHFSQMKQNMMTSCKDILKKDHSAASGVYEITIGDAIEKVYCDMEAEGGGWTVIQNRFDGSVDFYRNLAEYENGFGDLNGEFWLGLRNIKVLADTHPSELMLVLAKADGLEVYERYQEFKLLDRRNYTLFLNGRSTSGWDLYGKYGFDFCNGTAFSTFDRELYHDYSNCAHWHHGGAWWFAGCCPVNLNGEYCTPGTFCGVDNLKSVLGIVRGVVCTVIVLCWLRKQFPHRQEEWQMIETKALTWLASQSLTASAEDIIQQTTLSLWPK